MKFCSPLPMRTRFFICAIERWVTSLTNDDERKEPISSKWLAASSKFGTLQAVNSKYIVRYSIKTDLNDSPSPHTLDKLDAISHICFVCLISGIVTGWKRNLRPSALCILGGCIAIVNILLSCVGYRLTSLFKHKRTIIRLKKKFREEKCGQRRPSKCLEPVRRSVSDVFHSRIHLMRA